MMVFAIDVKGGVGFGVSTIHQYGDTTKTKAKLRPSIHLLISKLVSSISMFNETMQYSASNRKCHTMLYDTLTMTIFYSFTIQVNGSSNQHQVNWLFNVPVDSAHHRKQTKTTPVNMLFGFSTLNTSRISFYTNNNKVIKCHKWVQSVWLDSDAVMLQQQPVAITERWV